MASQPPPGSHPTHCPCCSLGQSTKANHFQSLQWLPVVLGIKPELFTMTHKACRLKPTCLSPQPHLLVHSCQPQRAAFGSSSSLLSPMTLSLCSSCFFCLKHSSYDSFFGFQLRGHLLREATKITLSNRYSLLHLVYSLPL